jgi:hypothetical protein
LVHKFHFYVFWSTKFISTFFGLPNSYFLHFLVYKINLNVFWWTKFIFFTCFGPQN